MYYLMLLRVFVLPAMLLLGSLASAILLSWFIPDQFSKSELLTPLAKLIKDNSSYVSGGLLLAAAVCSIVPGWRLWQWRQQKGDLCHMCGGIMDHKNGRWGPYLHCLVCGNNRGNR
jgi:hypothetical protein